MSKLVCKKCQGTLFVDAGTGVTYTVHLMNGTPPHIKNYRCSKCGNIEAVYYPGVYFEKEPKEVEVPEVNNALNYISR